MFSLTDSQKNGLTWIVNILHQEKIPFQIAGGFAAKCYGSLRPLNDIDIDVPLSSMDTLFERVRPYVVYGPVWHADERWDLYLMTLEYHGQVIDISAAETVKIFDSKEQLWRPYPTDLSDARMIEVCGIPLPIMQPAELVSYKKHLSGEHQQVDISAVSDFLSKK